MFEKIYKSAIILIAMFIIVALIYVVVTPTRTVAQATSTPTTNCVVPESHVWEAIAIETNLSGSFLIYNKKTGETKIIDPWEYRK